jgi:hypothetical protein
MINIVSSSLLISFEFLQAAGRSPSALLVDFGAPVVTKSHILTSASN